MLLGTTSRSDESDAPLHATGASKEELRQAQAVTLASPSRRYSTLARVVFFAVDLLFGRRRTLSKFKALELAARVLYQAREQVAYSALTLSHGEPGLAHRIYRVVREARAQQDNEQWHWLLLEEMIEQQSIRENVVRFRLVPQLLAAVLYPIAWILFALWPGAAHRLNADFESHAELDYMRFVEENPALENEPFVSAFEDEFGHFASVADALRQIALDEREHKESSDTHASGNVPSAHD